MVELDELYDASNRRCVVQIYTVCGSCSVDVPDLGTSQGVG